MEGRKQTAVVMRHLQHNGREQIANLGVTADLL